MKRIVVGISIIIFLASSVSAQDNSGTLSLDDCIELALKNRAGIIAAQGREQLASANKRSALGAFLPRISASYTDSESKRRDIETSAGALADQDISNKSKQISGNLTLGPATIFDHIAARARHSAAKLDVIAFENDLILSVKTSFYAFLATSENVSVQEEAVKRAEEQLKLIESRYELGSASRSDVLKQKVQYGNDKLSLLKSRNLFTTSKASLAYTIGVDPRQEWNFASSENATAFDGSIEEAIEYGLKNDPKLNSLDYSLSAAGSDIRSAASNYLPTITGFGSYTSSEGVQGVLGAPTTFSSSSNTTTTGFRVSLNIFDGFIREGRLTSAKVNRNNFRARLADAQFLAISVIKTIYLDIDQLREQKIVSAENVEAATEDLKITQERYNLGAASILDLLDAQVSLKQAQVLLIQADFDLNTKIAELDNAMGKVN